MFVMGMLWARGVWAASLIGLVLSLLLLASMPADGVVSRPLDPSVETPVDGSVDGSVGAVDEGMLLVGLANAERQSPMAVDGNLAARARSWADQLAASGVLAHSSLQAALASGPYGALAENVGYGPTAQQVHDAWMNSAGHRANILNPSYTLVGAGSATAADGTVWAAMLFAAPAVQAAPAPAPAPAQPAPKPSTKIVCTEVPA